MSNSPLDLKTIYDKLTNGKMSADLLNLKTTDVKQPNGKTQEEFNKNITQEIETLRADSSAQKQDIDNLKNRNIEEKIKETVDKKIRDDIDSAISSKVKYQMEETIKEKVDNKMSGIDYKISSIDNKISGMDSKIKSTVKEQVGQMSSTIESLKTHVNDGKSKLYAAIVDKKVVPSTKDFNSLVEGVKKIKIAQGNAKPSQVLRGKSFTNDDGIQFGNMNDMGKKVIDFKGYRQELGSGYYESIIVPKLETNNVAQIFTSKDEKANIIKSLYDSCDDSTKKELKGSIKNSFNMGLERYETSIITSDPKIIKSFDIPQQALWQSKAEYHIPLNKILDNFKAFAIVKVKGRAFLDVDLQRFCAIDEQFEKNFEFKNIEKKSAIKTSKESGGRGSFTWVSVSIEPEYIEISSDDRRILDLTNINLAIEVWGI